MSTHSLLCAIIAFGKMHCSLSMAARGLFFTPQLGTGADPAWGQVGSATLSSQILWPSVNNCNVVAHTGAYTSNQCQGLSPHNIVLLLVATLWWCLMTVRLSNMEKGDPAQTSSLNLSYLNLIIKSQLPCLMLGTVHNCCITDRQAQGVEYTGVWECEWVSDAFLYGQSIV